MKRKRRNLGNRVQLVVDEVLHLLGHSSRTSVDAAHGPRLQLTRLEERVLIGASPMATVAEVASVVAESSTAEHQTFVAENNLTLSDTAQSGGGHADSSLASDQSDENTTASPTAVRGIELIVIDSRVQDADTLLENLLNTDRDFRILRLDADLDGLRQISDRLDLLRNVSAIHLLTHGTDGQIFLGSTTLNASTLNQHAPEFMMWQRRLTENADLLLYGCDVAEAAEGKDLIDALAELTQADIAASDDATGHEGLGGDWVLEQQVGDIETSIAFTAATQSRWWGLLTPVLIPTDEFLVNTTTADDQTTESESRNSQQAVAVNSTGNYVVVWSSHQNDAGDSSGYRIVAQRFDSTGTAIGGEILVNTTTAGDQNQAGVAIDDSGRFVVVWAGASSHSGHRRSGRVPAKIQRGWLGD